MHPLVVCLELLDNKDICQLDSTLKFKFTCEILQTILDTAKIEVKD